MNIHAKLPSTPEEFIVWNEDREGKREFVRGRVVEMMIHTTRNHARLCNRLMAELGKSLLPNTYDIGSADFAVKTNDGVRYPDVFVDLIVSDTKGTDLSARHPVLLVEVLSPSSHSRDFGEKVDDYKGLPTLQHYLILSQDEPRAWLWSRKGSDWQGPEEYSGQLGQIELNGIGASFNMQAQYHGIA
jgi:Uma2 family endonuclease